jgi:sulfur carrier protein
MLSIYLNDEIYQLDTATSLHDFLTLNNYDEKQVAVAINHQVIPRVAHPRTILKAGDRVDIIVPMQGG